MGRPMSTRLAARTVVVVTYVVALALVGEPDWLAVLLGLALAAVFASPFLLATNRRRAARSAPVPPAGEPREAEPAP